VRPELLWSHVGLIGLLADFVCFNDSPTGRDCWVVVCSPIHGSSGKGALDLSVKALPPLGFFRFCGSYSRGRLMAVSLHIRARDTYEAGRVVFLPSLLI